MKCYPFVTSDEGMQINIDLKGIKHTDNELGYQKYNKASMEMVLCHLRQSCLREL